MIPYNQLRANNNGPNAPEAASFEPVDASDMVNLLTGDFSYVLPLLNVPSPEGGYPLALSYHGGIAQNQEASWVGLGWNLNPGSINRNINGYPDDWGKTKYDEFFYDAGWTENEYNFSVGATINGTVSVGLGASWGSHRSTGGFVSLGYTPGGSGVGGSVTAGTDGVNAGVGYTVGGAGGSMNGYRVNIGTNGIGIGYGTSNKNSGAGFGLSLNYNYNSGLSGGFSVSSSEKVNSEIKSSSLGINFGSNGATIGGSVNGRGAGISNTNFSLSGGNYDINISSFQAIIPIYTFYIGFGHKRISYSLYKKNDLTVSGAAYPYHANKTKLDSNQNPSYLMEEDYFMDVNEFSAFSHKNMSLDHLIEQNYKVDKNNFSLPSYDSYTVTSQGLSGNITPASFHELNMVDRGRGEANNDNIYTAYVADNFDSYLDRANDLGGSTHFYFENEFSTFLRMDRSTIYKNLIANGATEASDFLLFKGFETANTNIYSSTVLPNGDKLKSGNRKRSGSYIETFTNKQIRENSNITGFIEAKNINRAQEVDTFLDEGIGAFRITAIDGKIYHYSLPVYNFELFYKNFKDQSNEDQNFFEIKKTEPYATHWLLTAITGPDYIDVNADGKVDKEDYGYWVEFDYGKWTDGYVWKGPVDGYEVNENKENPDDKTYSYYWGRKQVYYLDAVKTRTHTALFVKHLRVDNKSSNSFKDIYKNKYTGGTFDVLHHSKVFSSNNSLKTPFAKPYDKVFKTNNEEISLPWNTWGGRDIVFQEYRGDQSSFKYIDIPENKTLGLSKILLLKNENISTINKSRGVLTNSLTGYSGFNTGYVNVIANGKQASGGTLPWLQYSDLHLLTEKAVLKDFKIHQHQKVLDIKDVAGLNLEEKASQVIDFNYDYSLAQQSSNSEASTKGRLSLKEVNFKGKKGKSLIPPYRFFYNESAISYDKNNQDEWGYHNSYPQAWSLNSIVTPTGGIIKINQDSDSYYSEAAYDATKVFENIIVNKNSNSDILEITFLDTNINLDQYFNINTETSLFFNLDFTYPAYGSYTPTTKIKAISINNSSKKASFKIVDYVDGARGEHINNFPLTNLSNTNTSTYSTVYHFSKPSIKSTKAPNLLYTDINANGKRGGGLRVSSIEVTGDGTRLRTVYDYTNLHDNKISGITSYAPSKEQKGIPYVSELPSPLVTYGNVTLKNYDGNNNFLGSTSYEFDVLKPFEENPDYLFSLGDFFKVKEQQNQKFFNGQVQANKYTIYNKISDIGRVKAVTSYNKYGQVLNKTVSNYKENLDNDGQIGVSQQSYKSIKKLKKGDDINFLITSSSKVDYPSVLESTTNVQSGFTNITYFDNHDFLTGQVTETKTVSSNGTEYKTKIIPAYIEYESMGSKVDNPTHKNMLTQTAANLTQIKVGSTWKTIGADITTWNDNWTYRKHDGTIEPLATGAQKIWRKHKTYTWKGDVDADGAYVGYTGDFDGFVWGSTQTNPKWINTATVTMYDHYSMPLESEDINGNKVATKMGDNNTKIMAVANAGYNEMFYSGAEYKNGSYIGKEIEAGNTSIQWAGAHTGSRSLGIKSGDQVFKTVMKSNEHRAGDYKISVWVYNKHRITTTSNGIPRATSEVYDPTQTKININGVSKPFNGEIITAGNWILLNHYEYLSTNAQTIFIETSSAGEINADDFRIHPVESSMTSYVYNQWDELTHIIGANNLATRYEYDEAGRLKKTYVEVVDSSTDYLIDTEEQNQIKNIFINSISYIKDCVRQNVGSLDLHIIANALGMNTATLSAMNDTEFGQKLQEYYEQATYTVSNPEALRTYRCLSDVDKQKIQDIFADTINGKGIGGFKLSNTVQYKYKNQ
ncbi:hypothetical protein ATO12_05240 [Aquimarina atlantica]|uniref:Uncharacterized protein n=1 Tax=Aquimarina atlantica TaxID=1317122 RepID=A0A023BP01_9FLAO|nr:hypothetical protein [Aquimarina atlantica]EZH71782.1 hypothetical protein ATO12_05240 [Aquimarina atlantica]